MRIISGKFKGKKLNSWKGKLPLRPMTDQVKETVFNVLAPYFFENCLVLDLFSGTGNLALEALSRGASQAHVVENHPSCLKIIKKNSQILDDSRQLVLHRKNVFSFLNQTENTDKEKQAKLGPFDIILADPPFAIQAGHRILEKLQNSLLTAKGSVVVIETGKKEDLKNKYSECYLFSEKTFSDKKIWFYEFQ